MHFNHGHVPHDDDVFEYSLQQFAAAGLKDALIQSGVVAEGSVEMALLGKCYNRGVRLCKLFYEALMRLLPESLAETEELDRENLFITVHSDDFVMSKTLLYSLKYSERLQTFFNQLRDLKIQWNNSCFTPPKFWISFIDMVGLLLNTIYSCRLGRRELLLECIRKVIPYAFAYDRVSYA